MSQAINEIDERAALTANNKFELMLFRLGRAEGDDNSEIYGINVFKIRELLAMPQVHSVAGTPAHLLGVVNIRGQVMPVIDLPSMVGCTPQQGCKILMVTEFSGTTQAFAVESVDEIVRLNWSQVRPAEGAAAGGGTITSIAQLDTEIGGASIAQILDVEQILQTIFKPVVVVKEDAAPSGMASAMQHAVLFADDSLSVRKWMAELMKSLNLPCTSANTGLEAWKMLEALADAAAAEGVALTNKVSLVITDLEMPEMDGFTLTRKIRDDARFKNLPVIIHSSLSGSTNAKHVTSAGANAQVAKTNPAALAQTIEQVLHDTYSAA